jgi:lipopolysaccharide transport system ATP-binding protein
MIAESAMSRSRRRILTVEAVSKRFLVSRRGRRTLRESTIRWLGGVREPEVEVCALHDVSFSVDEGAVVGVIGHNGAGKSTLLRLLCGLGRPTTGRITSLGHVSGLLELGGGFHRDLSGRDNLVTAGLLAGLSAREVRARQAEIIAFAELDDVIDQPVRTYSSGMYLRLAFAAAVSFDPTILVIDEVLAVGDSRFQAKCLERIAGFRAAGRTLVLASHDPQHVIGLCDDVIVLDEGRLVMRDEPRAALAHYDVLMQERTERRARQLESASAAPRSAGLAGSRLGTQEAAIETFTVCDIARQPATTVSAGAGLTIELSYRLAKPLPDLALSLGVSNIAHGKCFESFVPSANAVFGPLGESGMLHCELAELPLLPGRYFVDVGLYPPDCKFIYDYHWQMHPIDVVGDDDPRARRSGVVSLRPVWSRAGRR